MVSVSLFHVDKLEEALLEDVKRDPLCQLWVGVVFFHPFLKGMHRVHQETLSILVAASTEMHRVLSPSAAGASFVCIVVVAREHFARSTVA